MHGEKRNQREFIPPLFFRWHCPRKNGDMNICIKKNFEWFLGPFLANQGQVRKKSVKKVRIFWISIFFVRELNLWIWIKMGFLKSKFRFLILTFIIFFWYMTSQFENLRLHVILWFVCLVLCWFSIIISNRKKSPLMNTSTKDEENLIETDRKESRSQGQ